MGLTTPESIANYAKTAHPDYTPAELEALKKQYTPEQYEAILAGEAAIDPKDLSIQGRLRDDPYRIKYFEDFAVAQPIIDVKPEKEVVPKEVKWLGHKEWVDDYIDKLADKANESLNDSVMHSLAKALQKVKVTAGDMIDLTEDELRDIEADPELRKKFFEQDVTLASGQKLEDLIEDKDQSLAPKEATEEALVAAASSEGNDASAERIKRLFDEIDQEVFTDLKAKFVSPDEHPLKFSRLDTWKAMEEEGNSALAPELGKVEGVKGLYKATTNSMDDHLDETGELQLIKRQMGMSLESILSFTTKVLVIRWVHNQTRLGKIRSVSVLAIAGNGDGRLGIGQAKSTEHSIAVRTAKLLAIRNMKPIRRYENRTIYGNVESKVSGTVVRLQSRPPGKHTWPTHILYSTSPSLV
jgi:small subunit ribosomal protein S5